MRPEPRAVIFDLDDTLYPLRRFVRSGFRVVARRLEAEYAISARRIFRTLCRAGRGPARGHEIQHCLARYGWSPRLTSELVELIRHHRPELRLPGASRDVLETLRPDWRLAVVTNGPAHVQAAKIDALGLRTSVDAVVLAEQHGTGRGKPEAAPFEAALMRLGVEARHAVFVGNDERCDVRGAAAVGLFTVRLSDDPHADEPHTVADAVVGSILDVPVAAAHLLGFRWSRHVA